MSPTHAFSRLRREPRFLLRHYAVELARLVVVAGALLAVRGGWPRVELSLAPIHALALVAAVPLGWWVSSIIHNAGHGNFSRRGINTILGELAGAYLGYGFCNFILIHSLHHAYADQPQDPVSPRGMSFLRFLSGPLRHATVRARAYLDRAHGASPYYPVVRTGELLLFHTNLALRVACWYLLFGPNLFVALYIPSILSNVAILAHINYACHRDHDDGSVEIVNLHGNLYYRLANAVTSGGYFHKNHHLRPNVFDPRSFDAPRRLLSIEPDPTRASRPAPRAAGWLKRYFDLAGIWEER